LGSAQAQSRYAGFPSSDTFKGGPSAPIFDHRLCFGFGLHCPTAVSRSSTATACHNAGNVVTVPESSADGAEDVAMLVRPEQVASPGIPGGLRERAPQAPAPQPPFSSACCRGLMPPRMRLRRLRSNIRSTPCVGHVTHGPHQNAGPGRTSWRVAQPGRRTATHRVQRLECVRRPIACGDQSLDAQMRRRRSNGLLEPPFFGTLLRGAWLLTGLGCLLAQRTGTVTLSRAAFWPSVCSPTSPAHAPCSEA
jgi:hypothetical protein